MTCNKGMKKYPNINEYKTIYKKLKKLIKLWIKELKSNFIVNKFVEAGNNIRKVWDTINTALNKNTSKTTEEIQYLVSNGNIRMDN